MLVVAHNLPSMNTQRQLGINTKKRAETTEKLSSGYQINRAADDAAGLSISEKMRRLIRGLNQGTRNAQDGISWVQTGDGALNEAHDILHRMSELSIQALNETNSESDRMALQQEFDALQTELDRISETTKFNEMRIFQEHDVPYYQCEGDIKWEPEQIHVIDDGMNDLVIKYRDKENSATKTISIKVPAGEYRTQELADEIDSALWDAGAYNDGIMFEYNTAGYCNVNFEGGEVIDSVSGALSYLLYDMYEGGDYGALVGTTSFEGGYPLEIGPDNNTLTFTIEDFEGNVTEKTLTIPNGRYTREELIDTLNNELSDTSVTATAYGSGIKLGSSEAIVTKFKGNMFKIDTEGKLYTSVFYDNVGYGNVTMKEGTFRGGYVLTTDARDEEHQKYNITDTNNTLTLQPNGMETPTTITIPEGRYTASEMASKLNELFAAAQLELSVRSIGSGGFEGLEITSGIKGIDSKINIDTSSSAYNTLFVTREYNQYGTKAVLDYETKADNLAYFKGSKDLSGLANVPLTITAGVNDTFVMNIDGAGYNIKLTAGTYTSIGDVVAELNNQLSGANAAMIYKGKVEAVADGDVIMLRAVEGSGVSAVAVAATAGNTGYEEIFQGYSITYRPQTAQGTGSVTLNKPFDGTVEATDNPFKVTVGGKEYTITLPTGSGISEDAIKTAIEMEIPGYDETLPNKFEYTYATGTTGNRNFGPTTSSGREDYTSWSQTATGKMVYNQGTTIPDVNEPAVLTIGPKLQDSMTVTDDNNRITLTVNGSERVIILDNGTYSRNSLAAALQSKLNATFGTGFGGATVSLSGDNLVLTANLDTSHYGDETSISCSTENSSFLKELNTTRTAAKWTSTYALAQSGIVIDDTTNEFSFSYTKDGATENITITLDNGTYTRDTLVNQINSKLEEIGADVTASVYAGCLRLTSGAVGNGVSISYGTATGGSSSNVILGELNPKTPAKKTVNLKTEDSITIDNTTNQFTIRVNGADKTVTLDNGTYTRDAFVSMLNDKFSAINAGIEAYVDGDKIGYQTVNEGSNQSFSISYDTGGSAMKQIYGETTTHYPGVTVSFDGAGNMMLETEPGVELSVSSNSGGGFQEPQEIKTPIATSAAEGFSSTKHGSIDGVNLTGDVTIDQWNNNLTFTFRDEGTDKNVSIEVPDGTYTYQQLQDTLQGLLDTAAGADKLTVTVDASGVRIETVGTGSTNRLTVPGGDFYNHVMCQVTERTVTQAGRVQDGTQTVTPAFTVGREDIVSEGVEIKKGISDELTIDLTCNGTVYTLEMKLEPGSYSADGIKQEIQQKLNEQLVANGFEENFIEVGVGDINTGVVGANDSKALNFKISGTVKAPGEGNYVLDGVGGNAAFEVFYKTDGELIPAFIRGTKDVSNGVSIKEGENQLHFKVDDVEYDITLAEGYYFPDSIINTLNEEFEAQGAPLVASIDEGRVKISHTSLGDHEIQEVSGSARDDIFFREHGQKGPDKGVNIQLSSETEDNIEIPRMEVSTTLLGINSVCISKVKYASKALDRISDAIEKVSELRSTFGSVQNKLEHAIASNENKAENTTAAESRIRDANMAKEMMELAKQNILQQAGEAMLAQANASNDEILALLQR